MKNWAAPPRLALWLLDRLSGWGDDYGAAGDFEEFYRALASERGVRHARRACWRQVGAALPGYLKNLIIWSDAMLKHYFRIAFRNLRKYKGYSFINIAGLAVGMACFIFIMLYVQYERSFDGFHDHADDIYRVQINQQGRVPGRTNVSVITYGPLASTLVSACPEVIRATRIEHRDSYELALKYQDIRSYEKGFYVDGNFFDLFTYDLIRGDPGTVLTEPFSIVISERLAKKYFGGEDPLGKTLTIVEDKNHDVKITGVIKDVPANSHLRFDYLLSMISLNAIYEDENFGKSWGDSDFSTYIKLRAGSDPKELEAKLPDIIRTFGKGGADGYYLMPIKDIHLRSADNFDISANADIQNIRFLSLVAYVILLVACLNYMNLATAKALRRAKESCVRKIVGAFRKQLIAQFLYEALIQSAAAVMIAGLITAAALPAFNALTQREMALDLFHNTALPLTMIGLVVITGILAGLYPAFQVASFRPVSLMKGNFRVLSRRTGLRNVFVAFQFCVSIILITCMFVIGRQVHFIKSKDVGYDREQVLAMPIRDDVIRDRLDALKNDLLKNPAIRRVSASSHIPNKITWSGRLISKRQEPVTINSCAVDYDYVSLFDIKIIEGRDFSRDLDPYGDGAFLLSETAVKSLGWDSPLGMECDHWGQKKGTVVGVFKDFHFQSLHAGMRPLYLVLYPERTRVLFIRMQTADIRSAVRFIGATVESYHPAHPFDYFFLDDSFNEMYKSEQKFSALFKSFSALALFIACLGLLGLISYSAEMRTKEIGIRKTLGASIPKIVMLLSEEFTRSVLVANLIAWPAAYYIMSRWLRNFAYRVDMGPGMFALSGAVALVIAWLTVSIQTVRAASSNPVDALRYE